MVWWSDPIVAFQNQQYFTQGPHAVSSPTNVNEEINLPTTIGPHYQTNVPLNDTMTEEEHVRYMEINHDPSLPCYLD